MKELIIYRFKNGIQLIRPGSATPFMAYNTGHNVAEIMQLPFNFYFLNTQGHTQIMNEESALMCGFNSAEDALGKSLHHVSLGHSAAELIDNCTQVINEQLLRIFEEENVRKDGTSLHFLSIKCPWYNSNEQIMGVFGCSIVLGKHSLSSSLASVIELGLFDSAQIPFNRALSSPSFKINKTHLSKREIECLRLTIKGYTAKRIAKELDISHRTVEEYLVNIRIKAGAASKAELIEMTIDQFIL